MPAQKQVPITKAGLQKLHEELEDLLTNKRPEIVARMLANREESPGTQAEGEFDQARNDQAFVEGRIRTIENIIANAQLIDEEAARSADTVQVGATVSVKVGRKDQSYTIVGMAEVDPAQGFVSDESPVGRALLGRKVGDTVEVDAPAGAIKMTIKAIK